MAAVLALTLTAGTAFAKKDKEEEPKPGWPSPQARCQKDDQCDVGLVCQPIEGEVSAAQGRSDDTPLRDDQGVCQPGCRIDGVFRTPGEIDAFPDNCQSCQPEVSTTAWSPLGAGTLCRAAVDVCDVAEVCDGATGTCPTDAKRPSDFSCRAPADVCDAQEFCDGSNDACPADLKKPSTTSCRAPADVCDAREFCDGSNDACPADLKEPGTTSCRDAAGECDVEEFCDGTSDACPVDEKSTAECRPQDGFCDVAEFCDGIADDCPADGFEPATTECRAIGATTVGGPQIAAGCDLAEFCPGDGPDCPADEVRDASYVCRASRGDCDPEETCANIGTSKDCPLDIFSTGVCREAAGECDVAEEWDNETCSCPADAKQPVTEECRAATGDCDRPEFCDGGDTCPTDQLSPPNEVCRAAANDCDLSELCSGSSPACPSDQTRGEGDACGPNGYTCQNDVCRGNGQVGDGCSEDLDCDADLHCIETIDGGGVCDETDRAGFNDACDGDDQIVRGDSNGTQCSSEADLVCCKGSTWARDGETGSCKECCTSSTTGDAEFVNCGDPGTLTNTCCSGRCAQIAVDEDNCGECGFSCTDLTNECYPTAECGRKTTDTGCGFLGDEPCFNYGICDLDSADLCGDNEWCLIDVFSQEPECRVLFIDSASTPGAKCTECSDNSDCDSGLFCASDCDQGGFGSIFCFSPKLCVGDIGDCS